MNGTATGRWVGNAYHESGQVAEMPDIAIRDEDGEIRKHITFCTSPALHLQQMGRGKRVPQVPAVQRAQHGDDFWSRLLNLNEQEK